MTITTNHPTDIYEARRLAELEVEIAKLDNAMTDARDRIEKFVKNHPEQRTTFSNGVLVGRIGVMESRHQDLRSLEQELNNFVICWHATLAEYATLKQKK